MLAATVMRKTSAFGKVFFPGDMIKPDLYAKMPMRNRSALIESGKIQVVDLPDDDDAPRKNRRG